MSFIAQKHRVSACVEGKASNSSMGSVRQDQPRLTSAYTLVRVLFRSFSTLVFSEV